MAGFQVTTHGRFSGDHRGLVHAPEDSELASKLSEQLKYAGAEAVSRTVLQSKETFGVAEYAELEELGQYYLTKLKSSAPMEMEQRVFLSYASEDYYDVFRFHLELLRMGMFTFLDQSETMGVRLGENWAERIFEMLSTCFCMAMFLSPYSIQSTFVGYEVGFFIERMRIRSGVCLAIVLLQPMDTEDFKQQGIPVIEFYRLTAKDAADQFMRELVAFYEQNQNSTGNNS